MNNYNVEAKAYRFPNYLNFSCVGTREQIQDLSNYFDLRRETEINIEQFTERIIFNRIYCHVTSEKKHRCLWFKNRITKKLKDLNITENRFLEGLFLTAPDEVCELLELDKDELYKGIIEDDFWNSFILFPV